MSAYSIEKLVATIRPLERHALIEAAAVLEDYGIEIKMPWECDLDDREAELFEGLVNACRAYDVGLEQRR